MKMEATVTCNVPTAKFCNALLRQECSLRHPGNRYTESRVLSGNREAALRLIRVQLLHLIAQIARPPILMAWVLFVVT